MRLLLFVALIFFNQIALADWDNGRIIGTNDGRLSQTITVDPVTENIYVAFECNLRQVYSDTTFEYYGNKYIIIHCYSKNFEILRKQAIYSSKDIDLTGLAAVNNQLILCGYYSDSLMLQTSKVISQGNKDGFILSINYDLRINWIESFGTKNNDYIPNSNSVHIAGNEIYMLSGFGINQVGDSLVMRDTIIRSKGTSNLILAKFNFQGEMKGISYIYSSSSLIPGDMQVDSNSNLNLLINSTSHFNYNSNEISSNLLGDFSTVLNVNSTNLKYNWNFNTALDEVGAVDLASMDICANGDILICGSYYAKRLHITGLKYLNNPLRLNGYEFFIIRIDPNGKYKWAIQGGGPSEDRAIDLVKLDRDTFVMTGKMYGITIYQYDTLTSTDMDKEQGFILCIDKDGNRISLESISKQTAYEINKMTLLSTKNIGIIGQFSEDPLLVGDTQLLTNDTKTSFFLCTWHYSKKTVSLNENSGNPSYSLMTNQSTLIITDLTAFCSNSIKDLSITNLQGNVYFDNISFQCNAIIDISHFVPGIYVISITKQHKSIQYKYFIF